MEYRKKPKRVGVIGNIGSALSLAISRVAQEKKPEIITIDEKVVESVDKALDLKDKIEAKPDPFAPEPFVITNIAPSYQKPFIAKPRKKRRQDLFKR